MTKARAWTIRVVALSLLIQVSVQAQKLPWRGKQAEVLAGATRVMLLPPDVHVDQWSTTSGRELSGTADHVRRTICGAFEQAFEERKVEVRDFPVCLGEGESTVERLDAVVAAGTHFRELVTKWTKPRREADLLDSFHLGDEQEAIKKLEVDALILVCADGNIKTKGEKAMGALGSASGNVPGEGLVLHIGVIRPRTGELLFFNQKDLGGDFLKHEERLEEAIEKTVQAAFTPPAPAPASGAAPAKAPGR
ncbi:MAG TPA: hypothetical protein VKG84_10000 [Candidatus Acidoferrales bacterium]|nr:hypothetical protein [Candidatus Acidoferrales bacterium]